MDRANKKIDFIVGARPNFMKVSAILKANDGSIDARLIHTGQHFDKNMSESFFEDLKIPKPNINLDARSSSSINQISEIIKKYNDFLLESFIPDMIVVVGDVDSTLACSLVARRHNVPLCHVEAGLRSGDMTMPEEINRIMTDSITDYFFVTSKNAEENLKLEGKKENIFFVGNTMIDTLIDNIPRLKKPDSLNFDEYFLLTMHRPSNVDNKDELLSVLKAISNESNLPIIFPVHPRTKKNLYSQNLKNINLVDPMPYLEFIYLLNNAVGVITDSGGITEEATFLNIPCITLRNTTERPETVSLGSNILVGSDKESLQKNINLIQNKKWKESRVPEKWDGKTGERIVRILNDL